MTALPACTILSKNYLARARALARSYREHHPDAPFFVLLVDRVDGCFDPEQEPFTVVEVESLGNVPDLRSFLFKYSLLECNTAVKPYFLEHLFDEFGLDRVVYLDPDMLALQPFDELDAVLAEDAIALTPHITSPIDDALHPSELAILKAGAYNLGFLGLRDTPDVRRFLHWWQEKLYDGCVKRTHEGLFVDQRWIDLVPGMFEGVNVFTHPGYNVAYWNLHDRTVSTDGGPTVNGRPLCLFHFSGFDEATADFISTHQDRFLMSDVGDAAQLFELYRHLLLDEGIEESSTWPYAFGAFDNDVPIPDIARRLYHEQGNRRGRFGDPFAVAGPSSFFTWLNTANGRLTRLLESVHASHPEANASFADPEGEDHDAFCRWVMDFGRHQLGLDDALLESITAAPGSSWSLEGAKSKLKAGAHRAYRSNLARRGKRIAKRLIGTERAAQLRDRVGLADGEPPGGAPFHGRMPLPGTLERLGINVTGYLNAETGIGEAGRNLAHALAAADVPHSLLSVDVNLASRNEDPSFPDTPGGFPYDVNLFCVNADQVDPVLDHVGRNALDGRYNIGFWLWELPSFPEEWLSSFHPFHEIWTPSHFCADAIAAVSPVPVRRVPIPVPVPPDAEHDRAHFGIAADAFAFLFSFDFLSYAERKNPLAVVRAFAEAFPSGDEAVLVVKSTNSDADPGFRARIADEIGARDVVWIDRYLSRQETRDLFRACDAYVSLHRSEGFGLTIAEAMALGKPVVATAYSGSADFVDVNNAWPVRYRLTQLTGDAGPYAAGETWADPDITHAAEQMRRLFENETERTTRAERARVDVASKLGLGPVGALLGRRLREIARLVNRERL